MYELSLNITYQRTINAHMKYLMNSGKYYDLKWIIENGIEIRLHKAIVCSFFPESMLDNVNVIKMPALTDQVASALLKLIYLGKASLETYNELALLKEVSKAFNFEDKFHVIKSAAAMMQPGATIAKPMGGEPMPGTSAQYMVKHQMSFQQQQQNPMQIKKEQIYQGE